MKQLNLYEKKDSLPSVLSGGQKRRTCLAMALVGDSNVSFLLNIFLNLIENIIINKFYFRY